MKKIGLILGVIAPVAILFAFAKAYKTIYKNTPDDEGEEGEEGEDEEEEA